MSAKDVSETLKPLVAVISPVRHSWFSHQEMLSAESLGAGTLLQANAEGYLFVTARHVIDGPAWGWRKAGSGAFIAMASGTWGNARVIARQRSQDLLLLWMPRENLVTAHCAAGREVFADERGTNHFVIGHPEGLRFTLSTGIISRLDGT